METTHSQEDVLNTTVRNVEEVLKDRGQVADTAPEKQESLKTMNATDSHVLETAECSIQNLRPMSNIDQSVGNASLWLRMSISNEALLFLAWMVSRRFGVRRFMIPSAEMSQRRMWVHPIVQMRQTHGHFHCLYGELRRYPAKFQAYCRLTVDMFDTILDTLRPHLQLQDTSMRQCISPEQRLLVTLRFLATGMSYGALHFDFLLGTSTICGIVRLTCDALWLHLKNQVMPQPTCEKWLQIAHGFYEVTKFPHCIGALDGKHIRVRKPPNSGSRYFNFHKFFSVVILALVDTNYKFIYVDIGAYGSASDARIFRSTRLARRMISMDLNLPTPSPLPGTSGPTVPFVMVAHEGFALSPHVMRPFPRRGIDDLKSQFNSRLKTARSYVECSFGILASKWRIYQTTIQLNPTNVQSVIKATVVLHNFCRIHEENVLLDPLNSHYAANFSNVQMENTQPVLSGLQIRNNYMCYFVDH
ncbi:uncharacterized protein LOC142302370 [Anomaloglossus baeobatrachus]|uniref:uncharacterized protein LOC142302370 n=1 Tax=Anomaloglossus baeobatrachus TaxID=238106 RepID=UPI003F4FED85